MALEFRPLEIPEELMERLLRRERNGSPMPDVSVRLDQEDQNNSPSSVNDEPLDA